MILLFFIAALCLGTVAMRYFNPSFLRFTPQEEEKTYAVIYEYPLLGKQDVIRYDEEKELFYRVKDDQEELIADTALIVSPDETMFYEVRLDAQGKVLKGWQETEEGRKYYDPDTGWMAIETQAIDGQTYTFDHEGYLLDQVWKDDLWYEGGLAAGAQEDTLLFMEGEPGFYYLQSSARGKAAKNTELTLADGRVLLFDENGHIVAERTELSSGNVYYPVFEAGEVSAMTQTVKVSAYAPENPVSILKTVNHRGYHVSAPENSLQAYMESWAQGYRYVECDIQFTADGIPVLLHNATVNAAARNADGSSISGNRAIADMTYEEVCGYDFGIAKGQQYAGMKITKLEDFLAWCSANCIHPYLEMKADTVNTQEKVSALVQMADSYHMLDKVTWISFSLDALQYVLHDVPEAEVGMLCGDTGTAAAVMGRIKELKQQGSNVFMDVYYSAAGSILNACREADIPLQVWTVNKESDLQAMDPYISGITTDTLPADIRT